MRIRFRFSLRFMLLFTVLVALLCSAYVSLPFATFAQAGNKITVRTGYPVNSVLFDANFQLREHKRVARWNRWWAEPEGAGKYTSWSEFTITYRENETPPECMILGTPYFGYCYYKVTKTKDGLKFTRTQMPQRWRYAMEKR